MAVADDITIPVVVPGVIVVVVLSRQIVRLLDDDRPAITMGTSQNHFGQIIIIQDNIRSGRVDQHILGNFYNLL